MQVFIAGGSGLVGRHLARALLDNGHQPIILSRRADEVRRNPAMWQFRVIPGDPATPGSWQNEVDGCDAVVNLAGHNIFANRWTSAIKRQIRDSRVYSAEGLVAAIKRAHNPPKVFVQGTAIGYYGPHGDEELTESSPSGTDFLAVVCRECEDASASLDSARRTTSDHPHGHRAGSVRGNAQTVDPHLPVLARHSCRQRRRHVRVWIAMDELDSH